MERSSPKLTLCSALCESLIINRFTFLGQLNLRQFSSRSMRRFEAKNVHCTKELKSQKGKIDGFFVELLLDKQSKNIWNFGWFWRIFFLDFFNVKHFFPYYLVLTDVIRSFWYESIGLFDIRALFFLRFSKRQLPNLPLLGKYDPTITTKKASFSFQNTATYFE